METFLVSIIISLEKIVEGIFIGGAGGSIAGLAIWLLQSGRDKWGIKEFIDHGFDRSM